MTLGLSAGAKVCDDCMTEYAGPAYYTFPTSECRTSNHRGEAVRHPGCTGNLCARCAGPDLEPDRADDPRRPAPRAQRFEVRALLSGEGWVIVDTAWQYPMIGPYPRGRKGRDVALARAAEFEADPSRVMTERERTN